MLDPVATRHSADALLPTEIADGIKERALRYTQTVVPEKGRKEWEGNATETFNSVSNVMTVRVNMTCTACNSYEFTAQRDFSLDDAKSLGDRQVIGTHLGAGVVRQLLDHNSECHKRKKAMDPRKTKAQPKKKAPSKKKGPACRICGTTKSIYPEWVGPCAHDVEKGAKYRPFDILASSLDIQDEARV